MNPGNILPPRRAAALLTPLFFPLLILAAAPALAQNKALDLARDKNTELHPSMRENLATIGRYAETVNRQVNKLSGDERDSSNAAGAPPSPSSPSPPSRQASPNRRSESIADPFEVSPQLRDTRRTKNGFSGLPASSKLELQRQIQLRALLIAPGGRAAQLGIRHQEAITVMDGELIDLGDLGTFHVRIDREGVTLSNPSLPQASKIVLR